MKLSDQPIAMKYVTQKHKTIAMKMKQNKNKDNYNEMNNKTQPILIQFNEKTQNYCNENEAKQK